MEHRAFVPVIGMLAAALVATGMSRQASAADPSGMREADDGQARIAIMPAESAEARVTVVPKSLRFSAPPDASQPGGSPVGFGMSTAYLQPLPLTEGKVSSLMIMATPSPMAAAAPEPATPEPAAVAPRAVTPKAKPKPVAQEPQERLSWLRLPWFRR